MEYKKKSLSNLDINKDYEEIDTRLASGWYVDDINIPKKKIYKTKQTSFKISKPEVSFMVFGKTIVSRITAFLYSCFSSPSEQLNIINNIMK